MKQNTIITVLLVAPLPPPVGGIASWTKNVTNYYDSLELKNVDLVLCDSSSKGRRITSRSNFSRIYHGIRNSMRIYKQVKKNLQNKPDVIHLVSSASYSLLKDILILRLAKRNKIPVITHWRFGRIPKLAQQNNWEYKLLSRVIDISAYSIVIDLKSYTTLIKNGFKNVLQMPNPLAADLGERTKYLLENYKTRPSNELLFVGHVVTGKGVYELVEACAQNKEVKRLTMVGPYEEETKAALVEIAQRRNNGEWLVFLGALEKNEVVALMEAHAILVLASYSEGFPNAMLEAMAMGCTIIGSFVGAIPEMLDFDTDNPSGICVPHQDVNALDEAIEKSISRPDQLEIMGKNGLKKVLSSYTMEHVFSEYLKHWKNSCASR